MAFGGKCIGWICGEMSDSEEDVKRPVRRGVQLLHAGAQEVEAAFDVAADKDLEHGEVDKAFAMRDFRR